MSEERGAARRPGRPSTITPDIVIRAALENDLAELSMLGIAKRLNITHGALYRYYPSRDELVLAAVNWAIEHHPFMHKGADWLGVLTGFAEALSALCETTDGLAFSTLTLPTAPAALQGVIDEAARHAHTHGLELSDAKLALGLISDEVLLATTLARRTDPASASRVLDTRIALILDGLRRRHNS
ncbi:TetR/AcrR family transcriptional regulator [Microbacterium sp.]|uniref:TetR/AcrR family transcriptional regulator n=1 Tax=Microbacterium sp. TaxID=51671 RepID=UPI003F9BEE36